MLIFFQQYLGMQNEYVDSSEVLRRIEQGIYDNATFEKALAWTNENCREGENTNPPEKQSIRAQKDKDWAFVVKMMLIIRDLMIGNPKLADLGFGEEALGHNALVSGFQEQRQWTDFLTNGDLSRPSRTHLLTGTPHGLRLWWQPKTTHSTECRCC